MERERNGELPLFGYRVILLHENLGKEKIIEWCESEGQDKRGTMILPQAPKTNQNNVYESL